MKNYNRFNHDAPEDRYITGKILKNPMLILCSIDENNGNEEKTIGAVHSIEKKLNNIYFRINVFDEWQHKGYGSYLLKVLDLLYGDRYYLCCKFSEQNPKTSEFFKKNGYEVYKEDNVLIAIKKPEKPVNMWNYANLHLRDLK